MHIRHTAAGDALKIVHECTAVLFLEFFGGIDLLGGIKAPAAAEKFIQRIVDIVFHDGPPYMDS